MKLRRNEIDYIAQQIVERLIAGDYLETADEAATVARVAGAMLEDLAVEDQLNEEVRQILDEHSTEVQQGGVEYYRMFNLVKAKLAKERNLIL